MQWLKVEPQRERASAGRVAASVAPGGQRMMRRAGGLPWQQTYIHPDMCAIYIIVRCDMNKTFDSLYYYTLSWAGFPGQSGRGFVIVNPVSRCLVRLPVRPKELSGS
jgi:hypothetical protein